MKSITIYFVNIILVFITAITRKYNYKIISRRALSGKVVSDFIICLSFTLIMALRSLDVGVDTGSYSRIYSIIGNSGSYLNALKNAPLKAPLYVLLCHGLNRISSDPQILLVVTAILINIGLFQFIKQTSPNSTESSLVWIGLTFFYFSMNGSRQCLAVVIALNAIYYLAVDWKSIKGWVLFVVAIGIHSTSMFLIVALLGIVLVNTMKDNWMIFNVSIIISVIISAAFFVGVKFFLKLFPWYSMYTSGGSQYSVFLSNGNGRIIILYLFLLVIVFLWSVKARKTNINDDYFNSRMLPAVVFCCVFGILNCQNELINRLLWYYLGIFVSFVPSMFSKYNKYAKTLLTWGVLTLLLVYSIISVMENQNGIMPYSFFWS